MTQRIVIAGMLHETNTFSPVPTPLTAFFSRARPVTPGTNPIIGGEQAIELYGQANVGFAGFLKLAREAGAEIDVPMFANSSPSAPTDAATFDTMAETILASVRRGCDAIMLDLHGAMVAEGIDDGEAELLGRIRAIAPDVPIAVALDFHANISPALIERADVITGYRTYPHIDMALTGERAGRTLLRMLAGQVKPEIVFEWLPMLTHMNQHSPQFQPMRDIMNRAIAAEGGGEVLNASVFGGFPLADIPFAGLSVVVVGDERAAEGMARARALAKELAQQAWRRRAEFVFKIEPLEQTVQRARELRERCRSEGRPHKPIVLADHSNNTASGGSVDTMESIEAILKAGLQNVVAGPICDPQTVHALIEAGVGSQVTLPVGGRVDAPSIGRKAVPLTLSGTVRAITDGSFLVTGPMMTGLTVNCGRTVVLDVGPLKLVISENRVEPFDLGVFRHCGIDPLAADFILLWSRQHFRAGFESIAEQVLMMAGPGVCSSDYGQFPFERLTRPIYPIDAHAEWKPAAG
ncbi:MAG: M81 family metallopeptidase [Burkholderiaceae bacterium]